MKILSVVTTAFAIIGGIATVTKLIWLALRNITAEWRRPAHHCRAAMNQFAIVNEDRFTKAMI